MSLTTLVCGSFTSSFLSLFKAECKNPYSINTIKIKSKAIIPFLEPNDFFSVKSFCCSSFFRFNSSLFFCSSFILAPYYKVACARWLRISDKADCKSTSCDCVVVGAAVDVSTITSLSSNLALTALSTA